MRKEKEELQEISIKQAIIIKEQKLSFRFQIKALKGAKAYSNMK